MNLILWKFSKDFPPLFLYANSLVKYAVTRAHTVVLIIVGAIKVRLWHKHNVAMV